MNEEEPKSKSILPPEISLPLKIWNHLTPSQQDQLMKEGLSPVISRLPSQDRLQPQGLRQFVSRLRLSWRRKDLL